MEREDGERETKHTVKCLNAICRIVSLICVNLQNMNELVVRTVCLVKGGKARGGGT